jgi:hypothetical protein
VRNMLVIPFLCLFLRRVTLAKAPLHADPSFGSRLLAAVYDKSRDMKGVDSESWNTYDIRIEIPNSDPLDRLNE